MIRKYSGRTVLLTSNTNSASDTLTIFAVTSYTTVKGRKSRVLGRGCATTMSSTWCIKLWQIDYRESPYRAFRQRKLSTTKIRSLFRIVLSTYRGLCARSHDLTSWLKARNSKRSRARKASKLIPHLASFCSYPRSKSTTTWNCWPRLMMLSTPLPRRRLWRRALPSLGSMLRRSFPIGVKSQIVQFLTSKQAIIVSYTELYKIIGTRSWIWTTKQTTSHPNSS
jgi:hypothetical protein